MRIWLARFGFLLLLLTAFTAARAQDNAGMTGIVTDATGAVLPGATVTLTNASRGLKFTVTSKSDGEYRFPNVPPAPGYAVTFAHDGFTTMTVNRFDLLVGITRTQDAKLQAGTSQAIEVNSKEQTVTLNTTDASIGNNIDIELVNDLPVQNRNSPISLFLLEPGINSVGAVTGARTDQNSITVDGMDVNDISTGGFTTIVGNIPVDATQEFRGTVAGLTSNIGTGSGGQFQLVTKSGTNKFHGNINEYHRDTQTVSNTWFNNNSVPTVARPKFIRNQFGGAIGGPALHDKLYFFADFYNSRIVQSVQGVDTVPLDSYRAGNISYVRNLAGCNVSTTRQGSPNAATCIGTYNPAQVFALDPGTTGATTIRGESPAVFNLINSRFPRANDLSGGDGINTGFFRFNQPILTVEYDGVGRIDYNINQKQRVFVQFHNSHVDGVQSVNRFATDPLTRPNQNRSYGFVGSHIWQIGNNKVNQAYFGDTVQVVSFPLAFNPNGNTYVSGFGIFTAPYDSGNIQRRRIPIPTVRDDFNWQLGTHTVGFGGSFKFIKTSNLLINDYNFYTLGLGGVTTTLNASLRPPDIATATTYLNQWDGAFALALGRVGSVSSNYNYNSTGTPLPQQTGSVRRYRYYQTELYAGDTWKATKELTLSYGLRYQIYSVPFDSQGAEAVTNIGFDALLSARVAASQAGNFSNTSVPVSTFNLAGSANNAPGFFQPNWHDLAPRFAFAYNPSYSPKTVISGSANVVYDRTVYNAINFIQNQSSFLFQQTATTNYGNTSANVALATDPRVTTDLYSTLPTQPVAPTITRPYAPYVNATTGALTGLTGGNGVTSVDPNFKTPYSIAFNAGVQQELPGRFVMKLNYAGRLGRRLLANADASQLIDYADPASGQTLSQAYAALEAQVRAGANPLTGVTAQPFFENQITRAIGGYPNKTSIISYNQTSLVKLGDITDIVRFLAQNSLIAPNAGVASQFARNTYYTNKGFSSYNGLLFTLSKNLSSGIKFDFNYTWSHSIDNVSVIANTVASGTGFVCDALNTRACRGNSDFDTTNVVNSNIVYQIPFGHGRQFGGKSSTLVNELAGGWNLSALPFWQSGVAYQVSSGAFLAGFANNDPAIYDGLRSDDVATHRHKTLANQLQAFNDPNAAFAHFRSPNGIEYGSRNPLRGPSQLYFDAGVSKMFQILPDNRANLTFRADGFNILNHPTFATPAVSLSSQSTFGVISAQTAPVGGYVYRTGQFSLRLEF